MFRYLTSIKIVTMCIYSCFNERVYLFKNLFKNLRHAVVYTDWTHTCTNASFGFSKCKDRFIGKKVHSYFLFFQFKRYNNIGTFQIRVLGHIKHIRWNFLQKLLTSLSRYLKPGIWKYMGVHQKKIYLVSLCYPWMLITCCFPMVIYKFME